MKNVFSAFLVGGFALLMLLLVVLFFYNNAHYRFRITVPDGRYSTSYYTNGYRQRGGCVYFKEGGTGTQDSSQVCGTFRVQKINP